MTLTNKSLELLKTDTSGRVRTTPERREALLDEFERSGLSGMRFAARYGLIPFPSNKVTIPSIGVESSMANARLQCHVLAWKWYQLSDLR